jgi:Fic family protein
LKVPRHPPDPDAIFQKLLADPENINRVFSNAAFSATVGGRYIHWDNLRFRQLPKGLKSHEEWWAAIKIARRSTYRALPFVDIGGRPFVLASPDELQRQLSEIDRNLSGRVPIPDQLTSTGSRDRYVVSALIEEAITSSQLEGASTTSKVARDMLRSGRQPRTKHERMIFNNFAAMQIIRNMAQKPLTPEMLYEIHKRLTDGTLDDEEDAGRLRKDQVHVTVDSMPVFEPPPAEQLPKRLERFIAFANESTPGFYIHPIVRAVLLHFILAYDHPFADGNGRTARAVFYWYILRSRYWLGEFVSISHILKKAPIQYTRAYLYTETDQNDTTYFILYQLNVFARAIRALHTYVQEKMKAMARTQSLIRQDGRFNYRQLALLGNALGNPDAQYSVTSHATSHRVVRQTARNDLNDLAEYGLLRAARAGKSMLYFPPPDLEDRLQGFGRS